MTFDRLIKENQILLDTNIYELCTDGISAAKASCDPTHSLIHVESIFDDLNLYLETLDNYSIDFNVLLPAIIFHDIWYASMNQTRNFFMFVLRLLYESRGSVLITKKYLKKHKVSKELQSKITWAIFRHLRLGLKIIDNTLLRSISQEERILCDLDELNQWNIDRITYVEEFYLQEKIRKTDVLIVLLYFKLFILPATKDVFWLDFFKTRFSKLKPSILKHFGKVYKRVYENPHKYLVNTKRYKYYLFIKPENLEKLFQ